MRSALRKILHATFSSILYLIMSMCMAILENLTFCLASNYYCCNYESNLFDLYPNQNIPIYISYILIWCSYKILQVYPTVRVSRLTIDDIISYNHYSPIANMYAHTMSCIEYLFIPWTTSLYKDKAIKTSALLEYILMQLLSVPKTENPHGVFVYTVLFCCDNTVIL